MSVPLNVFENYAIGGKQFSNNQTVSPDQITLIDEDVPAAKTGTLTVRTDANTGSLTMTTGHGITTGARLDLYWDGGSRRGVVVGTVATNVVPIDLGSGDDLPAAATAITAMVPLEKEIIFEGDDLLALLVSAAALGTFVFADDSDVELAYRVLPIGTGTQACWTWYDDNGYTNPLAGDSCAKVFLSHGDSTAAKNMKVCAGLP